MAYNSMRTGVEDLSFSAEIYQKKNKFFDDNFDRYDLTDSTEFRLKSDERIRVVENRDGDARLLYGGSYGDPLIPGHFHSKQDIYEHVLNPKKLQAAYKSFVKEKQGYFKSVGIKDADILKAPKELKLKIKTATVKKTRDNHAIAVKAARTRKAKGN